MDSSKISKSKLILFSNIIIFLLTYLTKPVELHNFATSYGLPFKWLTIYPKMADFESRSLFGVTSINLLYYLLNLFIFYFLIYGVIYLINKNKKA